MTASMRQLMEEYIISVIIVRAVMWVSGVDLFTRGSEAGIAIGVSLVIGAILTAVYNGVKSEMK